MSFGLGHILGDVCVVCRLEATLGIVFRDAHGSALGICSAEERI